jgi:hypothetical protein
MRKKAIILFLIFSLGLSAFLYAAQTITISGLSIPLIEGATHVDEQDTPNVKVETFSAQKPMSEVSAFYSAYLNTNGFLLIGGANPDGFDASVKKGAAMFTLKIYSRGKLTFIRFIW